MICSFVRRIRAVQDYRQSHIIVHAEANDWTKADRYCRELMQPEYGPGLVVPNSQDDSGLGRFGVYTNEDEKQKWADCIEQAFMGQEICYAAQFVSSDPEAVKAKFEDQVRFYRLVVCVCVCVWMALVTCYPGKRSSPCRMRFFSNTSSGTPARAAGDALTIWSPSLG